MGNAVTNIALIGQISFLALEYDLFNLLNIYAFTPRRCTGGGTRSCTGLCANIGPDEMEELKFGGEWILSEDETLVADGHEQRYLYMVVMGEVGIFKANDNGKQQHIATLKRSCIW